mgnify:CR=1 FL=1
MWVIELKNNDTEYKEINLTSWPKLRSLELKVIFLFNIKLFKLPKMKEKIFESDADSPNRNCKIK